MAEQLLRRAFLLTAAAYLTGGHTDDLHALQTALAPLVAPVVVEGWVA